MAEANQAKELQDQPVSKEDPISELSDIMKFDPVEAALEQADEALQIDLENELMGELALVEQEDQAADREPATAADPTEPQPAAATEVPEPVIGSIEEPAPAESAMQTGISGLGELIEPIEPIEPIEQPAARLADDAVGSAGAVEAGAEPATEELEDAFEEVFDETLSVSDDTIKAQMPPELESQLSSLLAGLDGRDQSGAGETGLAQEDIAASKPDGFDVEPVAPGEPGLDDITGSEQVDETSGMAAAAAEPEPVKPLDEAGFAADEAIETMPENQLDEPVEPAVGEAPGDAPEEAAPASKPVFDTLEEKDVSAKTVGDEITEPVSMEPEFGEPEVAAPENTEPENADPLASLAAIAENIDVAVAASASSEEADETVKAAEPVDMADPAPIVETAEIVDEAVAVDDDLDIPDVSFDNDVPKTPEFDDLDEEFSRAFNKLSDFDKVKTASASAPPDAPAETIVEPHLREKLDNIFTGMADGAETKRTTQPAPPFVGANSDVPHWRENFPSVVSGRSSEPETAPFPELTREEPSGKEGARRGVLIAMIVAVVAIAGGIGAFALSFGGTDEPAAPAMVKADDGPIKVKPKDPGGKTVPNEDKKVYEQVAGGAKDEAPAQEKLISNEEEPVDVVVNTVEPRIIVPNPTETAVAIQSTEAAPAKKNDDRIAPEADQGITVPAAQVIAIQPRKVKTLIVKPDGTLVPREEPAIKVTDVQETAPSKPAGNGTADNKVVAAGDGAKTTAAENGTEVAAVANSSDNREVTSQLPASADAAVAEGSEPTNEGVVVEGIPVPTPAPRAEIESQLAAAAVSPADAPKPDTGAETGTQLAAVDPAAAAPKSEWWVQISSQPSRESAQASYAELASRHGSIIGGRGVNIVKAVIEGKGTYYRVRIPGGSRNEAASLCSRLKSAGAGCFIAR